MYLREPVYIHIKLTFAAIFSTKFSKVTFNYNHVSRGAVSCLLFQQSFVIYMYRIFALENNAIVVVVVVAFYCLQLKS